MSKIPTFEIDGKEYELKITYKSAQYLNGLHSADEGGSLALVLKAVQGDIGIFPNIVHAALFHTGEAFAFKTIEKAIEQAVDEERLNFDDIVRLSNEVVTNSFFYRATAKKLLGAEAEEVLKELTK